MSTITTLDAAGRRRSPATYPDHLAGRPPKNKGRRYPADPPRVEEIVAVMREAGERLPGIRLRGLIVVLWRAGLRISEALALAEGDLKPSRGAMLVRRGKGGRPHPHAFSAPAHQRGTLPSTNRWRSPGSRAAHSAMSENPASSPRI